MKLTKASECVNGPRRPELTAATRQLAESVSFYAWKAPVGSFLRPFSRDIENELVLRVNLAIVEILATTFTDTPQVVSSKVQSTLHINHR